MPHAVTPRSPTLDSYIVAAANANIINLLRIPGEQQVMLKVVVAEVNRSAARSIGVNFALSNRNGGFFANLTGNLIGNGSNGGGGGGPVSGGRSGSAGGSSGGNPSLSGNLPTLLDNGQIALAINALRNLNLARSLAEPNLVTINGQQANFQAGGEFPVPIVTGFTSSGLQGVSFVPFGVQLRFTPVITDKDRIRLQVSAEVSTRDNANSANVGGTSVPSLNTRQFSTNVELREGQTLAVAGLISNTFGANSSRVPFFGDLPLMGRFLDVDSTSSNDQELVILVTPQLVHPLEAKQVPPLVGADVYEPGDLEFFLLGRMESRRQYDYRSQVMNDIYRMARYRTCEQIYMTGPQGHSDGK